MNSPTSEERAPVVSPQVAWQVHWQEPVYERVAARTDRIALLRSVGLFLLTLLTSLVAGTHFAAAYAHNQAASFDTFFQSFQLVYRNPAALLAGVPFAATLLFILLMHELGHFFACQHHRIHASYPVFIPAPTLIGTFGAFILIRSPIRSARALFDVGASGPLVGFIVALPALIYGIAHARVVPSLGTSESAELVFGIPLMQQLLSRLFHPGANPGDLLLHPVGRAAWAGLFATALNLLPMGQLDGGHIVRSLSPRVHRIVTRALPFVVLGLGLIWWRGWLIWAVLLFVLQFFRPAPIYDPTPLDPNRRFTAALAFFVFVLCFMWNPVS